MNKTCTICSAIKNIDQFYKHNIGLYGVASWCKECSTARARKKYQENREREIERSKKYNKNNPERLAANMRKCRERRPEHFKEYARRHTEENRDQYRIRWSRKNKVRKAAADKTKDKLTLKQWREIKKAQNNKCYYCNVSCDLELEHVMPLSKGGEHSRKNVVGACQKCNAKKQEKLPETFAKEIGRLFI